MEDLAVLPFRWGFRVLTNVFPVLLLVWSLFALTTYQGFMEVALPGFVLVWLGAQ